ncbi:MAG TPA: DUF2721 domain-containing protein [Candidatus Eremiobacteraceae bacterium]|nr:DUF2721 domain-containing protein [Candidatus Eremiobacteraceae bacterium]
MSALVTPAILILAAGSLVASTLVRLGRIVDQTRHLIEQADQLRRAGRPATVVAIIDKRIDRQLRRAKLTRNALWGYYVAIVLFLISSVVLALSQFIPVSFHWIGPTIVLLGGFVLLVATAQLVIEVGLSAGSLREEVESFRRRELEG